MFVLPIIPEDRSFVDPAPPSDFMPNSGTKGSKKPTKNENYHIKEKTPAIIKDKNWKLTDGFATSNKMSYFLPIHEICCNSPTKEQVLAEVARSPHCLLARETSYKRLPLHIACRFNAPEDVILALLDLCPRATQIKDSVNRLPLHYALANACSNRVISSLIKCFPSSVSIACKQGFTALHLAIVMKRDFHIISAILLQNPNGVLAMTKGGNDAISLAMREDDYSDAEAVRSFLHSVYLSVKREQKEYNAKAA